jgi:hypothetical protein
VGETIYSVIPEEMTILWEVIISSVVIKKKVRMNVCVTLNGHQDIADWF